MPGKQILVVEDDPKITGTLVHVLNEQGHSSTNYY
jgi:DNA-binding response OmpR family regulator